MIRHPILANEEELINKLETIRSLEENIMPPQDLYPESENPGHGQPCTFDFGKVNPKLFGEKILQRKTAQEDWKVPGEF